MFVFQTFHYLCYQDVKEVSRVITGFFIVQVYRYSCKEKKFSFSVFFLFIYVSVVIQYFCNSLVNRLLVNVRLSGFLNIKLRKGRNQSLCLFPLDS